MGKPIKNIYDPYANVDWSINYTFRDQKGLFAWPKEGAEEFNNLAILLSRLSLMQLDKCFQISRSTGKTAHKRVTDLGVQAEEKLETLVKSNKKIVGKYDQEIDYSKLIIEPIIEFTYCCENNRPERIFAFYYDKTIYPLWWDPSHQVIPSYENRKTEIARCSAGRFCHHPQNT